MLVPGPVAGLAVVAVPPAPRAAAREQATGMRDAGRYRDGAADAWGPHREGPAAQIATPAELALAVAAPAVPRTAGDDGAAVGSRRDRDSERRAGQALDRPRDGAVGPGAGAELAEGVLPPAVDRAAREHRAAVLAAGGPG